MIVERMKGTVFFKLLLGTPWFLLQRRFLWPELVPGFFVRGQDCRMCSGVCGAVSRWQCGVCDRPRRYSWERRWRWRYEGRRWWSGLSAVNPRLLSKQSQCWSGLTKLVSDLVGWNVDWCREDPLLEVFSLSSSCCNHHLHLGPTCSRTRHWSINVQSPIVRLLRSTDSLIRDYRLHPCYIADQEQAVLHYHWWQHWRRAIKVTVAVQMMFRATRVPRRKATLPSEV